MHKGNSKFGEELGMPHNGFANSTRPLPIARIQSDTSRSRAPSWAEPGCSAAANAPQYAPQFSGHVNFASGNQAETGRVPGRPGVRTTNELRLHSSLAEIGWTGEVEEINDALRAKSQSVFETILITTNGIILAGFGSWWLAMREGVREIYCIEYPLSDDEALSFIITYHLSRRRWNDFVRIRLALRQKPYLQQKALENMQAGGKYKGSTICQQQVESMFDGGSLT